MLELFGSGYVIDYCMSALLQESKKKHDEKMLWYYITDCLRLLTENTAKGANTEAGYITNRYADIISPNMRQTRTGDEIASDIIRRAGLQLKGEEVTTDNGSV